MKTRFATIATVAALSLAGSALAQAPRGAAVATLGTGKVAIDYGRPALKGRDLNVLMKDLPADRMWRAGENEVTTFTTEAPVSIGGKTVPPGKYSLYVHAGEKGAWALVLNRDLGVPLGKIWDKAPENMKNAPWPHYEDYTQAIGDKEVVRARMKAAKLGPPADLFTISLAPKGKGADLTLAWGNESWLIDVQPAK
jgi:Protein of unknown function (DUF2911)